MTYVEELAKQGKSQILTILQPIVMHFSETVSMHVVGVRAFTKSYSFKQAVGGRPPLYAQPLSSLCGCRSA